MYKLLSMALILVIVFWIFNKNTNKENYEDICKKNYNWYLSKQNYCKKICDSNYPIPSGINHKNRDMEINNLIDHNKRRANNDFCFRKCQYDLYMSMMKIT